MKNPKIGERVCWIDMDFERSEGVVSSFSSSPGEDGHVFVENGNGNLVRVHRTHLIRLKPKRKARDFWINEAMIKHLADDVATVDVSGKYPNSKFIHVREVLE